MIYLLAKNAEVNSIYQILEQDEFLDVLKLEISKVSNVMLDTETNGLDAHKNRILLISIGAGNNQFVIDCSTTDNITVVTALSYLQGNTKLIIGHNIKFDYKMIAINYQVRLNKVWDTMLVEQVLNRGNGVSTDNPLGILFSLEETTTRYVKTAVFYKDIRKEFIGVDIERYKIKVEHITYAAYDVVHLETIKTKQLVKLEQYKLLWYVKTIANPLLKVAAEIELAGFYLDKNAWNKNTRNNEVLSHNLQLELDNYVRHEKNKGDANLKLNFSGFKYNKERMFKVKTNVTDLFGNTTIDSLTLNSQLVNWKSIDDIIEIYAKFNQLLPVKQKLKLIYKIPTFKQVLLKGRLTTKLDKLDKDNTYTTNSDELEQYILLYKDIPQYEIGVNIAILLLKLRTAEHSVTSFGDSFINKVNTITNNIHTLFRTETAITGRLQSGGGKHDKECVNFQNLPRDPSFRTPFTVENPLTHNILTIDLAGAEVVIMCDKAHDIKLYKWAVEQDDAHSPIATKCWRMIFLYRAGLANSSWKTAEQMIACENKLQTLFNIKHSKIPDVIFNYNLYCTFLIDKHNNKSMRTDFKPITFGTVYGMYPNKCARSLNIKVEEAKVVLTTIKTTIPDTFKMVEDNVNFALSNGFLKLNDRSNNLIHFKEVKDSILLGKSIEYDLEVKVSGIARNAPIQGTQADMIKESLIAVHSYNVHNKLDSQILNTVHDELVIKFNVDIPDYGETIKKLMCDTCNQYLNYYKISADYHVAKTWVK